MRKYCISFALLTLFLWTAEMAVAILPSYPLHWRVEQSDLVGVVKVLGVRRGQPPLLEVELHKLYKGDYPSKDDNATRRIFIDLTGWTWRVNLLDPAGTGLAKYQPGSLYST